MKQVKFLAVALILVIAGSFSANAQKLGTVDFEGLVSLLPEAKNVQEKLNKFQSDTLNVEFAKLVNDLKEKDSIYRDAKTAASVKKVLEKDLGELNNTYANWQGIANQAVQMRQGVLMQPLIEKVRTAINAVAKEKGYTYVLAPDAFYVMPTTDDLTKAVANKLGLKLPATNAAPAAGK